ncbi:hypothetical protein M436DRAFT_40621 [Aureobasidium namibiae CBS 147.97]|uniref:Apple domain-containing protein n=1 Tax=Aureobasidium namibiae CBS 147.97 TaxID=1043004 RepID=A0A074WT67_9PEZI
MASKYAVALMALLGSAAAQGFNTSSSASTTSSASVPVYTDGAKPTVGGVTYLIQTDTSYQGQLLRLARKRQSDASIQSCLSTCSADVDCVGTAFVQDTGSCLYYSSVDTASQADSPGTDFALVQDRASSSTTSEVFNGTTSAPTSGRTSSTGVALPSGGSGNSTASATRPGVTGGAGNNSTSTRPTGSASRTSSGVSTTTSGAAVPSTPSTLLTINGVLFLIEIDISKRGITIDFALIFAKRAGQSLDDCLTTCAANSNCAATSFTESDGICTFYTSVESGSETVDDDSTFATVISRAGAVGSGANNGTSGGNTTTPVPATNGTAESFICPAFNAAVLQSSTKVTFSVSCSSFLIGTTFDIQPTLSKRQTFNNGLPQTLSNCVDLCSLSEECVGTTFDIARETCSYYSAISYSTVLAGFDSAVRVQSNNGGETVTTTTVAGQVTTITVPGATTTQYVGGATSTATVYSTITSTVYANGGGATAFPSGAVVTQVVPVSTITYVNTVSTITIPQNQNAAATVTVTVGGAGSGSGPAVTQTVYQTVDQNGNVIGSSTAGAVAGGAAGSNVYPTVTVFAACSTPAAQQDTTVWTTVYV